MENPLRTILNCNRIDVIDNVVDADGASVRFADDHYASLPRHGVGKCRGDADDDGGDHGYFDDRQIILVRYRDTSEGTFPATPFAQGQSLSSGRKCGVFKSNGFKSAISFRSQAV